MNTNIKTPRPQSVRTSRTSGYVVLRIIPIKEKDEEMVSCKSESDKN